MSDPDPAASPTREAFGSRAGFVMAAVGSAVGLGNIWRFPYVTAEGGGAAFVVLYLGMTFLIGVPMMMTEFAVGRRTRLSSVGALRSLGGARWVPLAYLFVLTSLLILAYLSVITGWTLRYALDGLLTGFPSAPGTRYGEVSTGGSAVAFHGVTMAATVGIVIGGIRRGIERASVILMPILFLLLASLALWSASLDGSGAGYAFYLAPSLEELMDAQVLQAAASHAFFSLSVGMGIMLTYGSYLGGSESLGGESVVVSLSDFSVAFVAGLVVFPLIFALGLSGQVGESTMGALFISLPGAFAEMGAVGRVVGVSFFVALALASITSTVSLLEVVAAVGIDEFGWSRRRATLLAGSLALVIGTAAALSSETLGILDGVAGELFVVIGVLGMALFFGWRMKDPLAELKRGGGARASRLAPLVFLLVRWVIPPVLLLVAWVALGNAWQTLSG